MDEVGCTYRSKEACCAFGVDRVEELNKEYLVEYAGGVDGRSDNVDIDGLGSVDRPGRCMDGVVKVEELANVESVEKMDRIGGARDAAGEEVEGAVSLDAEGKGKPEDSKSSEVSDIARGDEAGGGTSRSSWVAKESRKEEFDVKDGRKEEEGCVAGTSRMEELAEVSFVREVVVVGEVVEKGEVVVAGKVVDARKVVDAGKVVEAGKVIEAGKVVETGEVVVVR